MVDAPEPSGGGPLSALFCPDSEYFVKPFHAELATHEVPGGACDVLIGFDIEATGQETHAGPEGTKTRAAMVELGAVAVDLNNPSVPLAVFEGFMGVPAGCGWDERTVSEFWHRDAALRAKKALVEACTTDPRAVMEAFVGWTEDVKRTFAGDDASRVLFASDNPAFDAKWVDNYLSEFTTGESRTINLFFGRYAPVIDTSSYAMGAACHDAADRIRIAAKRGYYSEEAAFVARLPVRIPVTLPKPPHCHRAAYDAFDIAVTFAKHGIEAKLNRESCPSGTFKCWGAGDAETACGRCRRAA
jgi:hypothetical protein